MHSNLALISRHPRGKQSCMHHNLSQSPQSRDSGVRRWVGSMHAFEFRGYHAPVSQSTTVIFRARRSPPFLRQLVVRLNTGHGVGAGAVCRTAEPARGLGHGLIDAHLAPGMQNQAILGCQTPQASSLGLARSWHRNRCGCGRLELFR